MRVYLGQTRSKALIARLEAFGFGECVVREELPNKRSPWFFDNGAFKDWRAGVPFNVRAYEKALDFLWLHQKSNPDFIVAPDIVAGGKASADFSVSWLKRLRAFKAPLAFVVQDGMTPESITNSVEGFEVIFVGGSLPWKMKTFAMWTKWAHSIGRHCHVGRMGTEKRVRAALAEDVDSIDSCLPLWGEDNLQRFLRGFDLTDSVDFLRDVDLLAVKATTETELAECESRANRATPGPWAHLKSGRSVTVEFPHGGQSESIARMFGASDNATVIADAAFIASARSDVPALVAALREERRRWEMVTASADKMSNILDRTGACLAGIPMETLVEACQRVIKERDEARAERDARPGPEVVARVIRSLSQLHDFAAVYSPSHNTDMLVEAREALRLLGDE